MENYVRKNIGQHNQMRRKSIFKKSFQAFLILFIPISLILSVGIQGFGGYWDWSFPYFSNHLQNIYDIQSSSWIIRQNGTPLSYSPDIFLRLAFSSLAFFNVSPEIILYLFIVTCLTMTALVVWKITFRICGKWLPSTLLALASVINPLMFYKLLAGHLNYFPSLLILAILILYLTSRGMKRWRDVLILGLLLGIIGLQIQFFLFGFLFLFIWALFHYKDIPLKKLLLIPLIVLVLNASWLSNFISGANDATEVSNRARQISRTASASSSFSTQFGLTFSSSTHIDKIYPSYAIILFCLFWVAAITPLSLKSRRHQMGNSEERLQSTYITYLIIMSTLATGFYMQLGGAIQFISPMFREVGHFGPPIVMLACILMSYGFTAALTLWNRTFSHLVSAGLLVFIIFNAFIYITWIPTTNYHSARTKFAEFENVKRNPLQYRVLSYPFFGQYSFNDEQSRQVRGFYLSNVGYDNYLKYAGFNAVENALQSIDVKASPQYELLKTYDLSVLAPLNVKYLFDFSDVYESQYERYVPPSVYDNDVTLVKNDPDFFQKLIDHNPGKIKKISSKVYEILDYSPIVSVQNLVNLRSSGNDGSSNRFINSVPNVDTAYIRTTDGDEMKQIQPLFPSNDSTVAQATEHEHRLVDKTLLESGRKFLHVDRSQRNLSYRLIDNDLIVYSTTPSSIEVNDLSHQLMQAKVEEMRYTLPDSSRKLGARIGSADIITPLNLDGNEHLLSTYLAGEHLSIYDISSPSLIQNGDFNRGTWQPNVSNCAERDSYPKIGMSLPSSSQQGNYMSLMSEKHTACTYQEISLDPSKKYVLSMSVMSENAISARYALVSGGNIFASGSVPTNDSFWHSINRFIGDIPNDKVRLYIYADEPFAAGKVEVGYDDISIVEAVLVAESNPLPRYSGYEEAAELDVKQADKMSLATVDTPNLIPSINFSRGLWKKKVEDCGKYDDSPMHRMELLDKGGFSGSNAVLLGATRHTACTSTTMTVSPGRYTISFNYSSKIRGTSAYAIKFNDPDETILTTDLPVSQNKWDWHSNEITTPQGASSATLFLYTRETNQRDENISLYSDIAFRPATAFHGKHMLADGFDNTQIRSTIHTIDQSPSSRIFRIENAKFPVNIVFGENYNPQWRIQGMDDTPPYLSNGRSNAWSITKQTCSNSQLNCKYASNGNLESVTVHLFFKPQSNFSVLHALSLTSLILLILYVLLPRNIVRGLAIKIGHNTSKI